MQLVEVTHFQEFPGSQPRPQGPESSKNPISPAPGAAEAASRPSRPSLGGPGRRKGAPGNCRFSNHLPTLIGLLPPARSCSHANLFLW